MSTKESLGWFQALVSLWAPPIFVLMLMTFLGLGPNALGFIPIAGWWFVISTGVLLFALLLRSIYLAGKSRS